MVSGRTNSAHEQSELSPEDLRWSCSLDLIPADTTEDVEPVEGIIGQDRALKALKLGVELFSPGYNIFVCGLSGTGKATTIKTILEKIQPFCAPPQDMCYVFNFRDEDRPILLRFEKGVGTLFREAMGEAVALLRQRIPLLFEDDEFLKQRNAIIEEFNKKETELFTQFEQTIIPDGFVLGRVQEGQAVHPEIFVKSGEKAVMISDLGNLVTAGEMDAQAAEALVEKYREHRESMQDVFRSGVQLTREYQHILAEHERSVVSMVVTAVFAELTHEFAGDTVKDYLDQAMNAIMSNLDRFKPRSEDQKIEDEMTEFMVNLILDNKDSSGCPVIIETAPTFTNLFGTIERQQDAQGFWFTDFSKIKCGSILRAEGGFLVLNAADTLAEPGVWRNLQRVLLYRKLEIQNFENLSQQSITSLKPEAIDLNIKVILIGNNEIYTLLRAYERDFKKIFKVKADFDYEMPNSPEAVNQYTALVRKLIHDEGLSHFDNRAIATIVEYGARLAGSKRKLTTQFSEIADVVREANYWCRQNGSKYVTDEHVDKAIRESRERHGLEEDRLQELIVDEVIMIDTDGERVGQINGLAVYGGDRFDFGKPTRITAAVGAGEAGIINIEREARMSGSTHDKGVLILSGYFRETFAQRHPLTLSASLSFEQSYSGIDGDSASSTEIYALLSALSGAPISQRFAVTGSVNQKGDIQPIGGVNEKVEGFFDVCRARGLTGAQGVLIPIQNVPDLMLREDVVAAVRDERFHIHAVHRIEEGIGILTGVPAGARDHQGAYPPDSIFGLAAKRLDEFARIAKKNKTDAGEASQ
jgi:lon-related putative ATP-dependent protease